MSRLVRLTDLWVEGEMVEFGNDPFGSPVCVWVNHLNSFEKEDVRRAAAAAQREYLIQLRDPEDPDRAGFEERLRDMTEDDLVRAGMAEYADEDFMLAQDDMEADEKYREDNAYVIERSGQLEEEKADEGDPRWLVVNAARDRILQARADFYRRRASDRDQSLRDAGRDDMGRNDVIKQIVDRWMERLAWMEYLTEQAAAEIHFALRDCRAIKVGDVWDHEHCDHSVKLTKSRAEIKKLPDPLIQKVKWVLDNSSVSLRDAGNSGAPASSSGSSGPQKSAEESTPSIPVETSGVRPGHSATPSPAP